MTDATVRSLTYDDQVAAGMIEDEVTLKRLIAEGKVEVEPAEQHVVEEPAQRVKKTHADNDVTLRQASSITMERPQWAWEERIPIAGVSLMAGREGNGKTAFSCWLAARWTRGQLDGDLKGKSRHVVYIGSEDDPNTVLVPRLVAAGADLTMFHFVEMNGDYFEIVRHLDDLDLRLEAEGLDVAAVIIDPLDAHLGAIDTHKKAAVQAAIARAAELSQRRQCAVLGLAHLNKGDAKDILGKVVGSVGFTTSVRAVLGVGEHPDEPADRVVVLAKANMTDKGAVPAVRFRVEGTTVPHDDGGSITTAKVAILGKEMIDPDAILFVPDSEQRSKVDDAAEWLGEVLAAGPMPSRDVKRMAKEEGIAERTLKRAATKVVEGQRDQAKNGPTIWRLR